MTARFVIQEHQARTHHFDFRLEKDGVLTKGENGWLLMKHRKPGDKSPALRSTPEQEGLPD